MRGTWFHCSDRNLGERFVSELRSPRHMAPGESLTPRLCVCPKLSGCFAGRLFDPRAVYVYRATCGAVPAPRCVWDRVITQEHWIIHRQQMDLVKVVERAVVVRMTEAIRLYHRTTKQASCWKLRLAQLIHAATVLGERRRWMQRVQKDYGIGEPEDFILAMVLGSAA